MLNSVEIHLLKFLWCQCKLWLSRRYSWGLHYFRIWYCVTG